MIETATSTVIAASALVVASSVAVIAYVQYARYVERPPEYLRRERLRAYGEIMDATIAVNRLGLELMEENRFQVEFERYTMAKESEFTRPVEDVTEALHRNYHVVDPAVKDAVNDYLNFTSRYPRDDVHPGELLSLTSEIVIRMRDDLDLPKLFPNVETEDETSTQSPEAASTDRSGTADD